MTMPNGDRWHIPDYETYMQLKQRRQLVEFQASVFRNALTRERKSYQHLLDNQEQRKESYKPPYETKAEVMEAYEAGLLDYHQYSTAYYMWWQVYSDRGHLARIEWLEEELAEREKIINAIEEAHQERHAAFVKSRNDRHNRIAHKRSYNRQRQRRIRKPIKEAKMLERQRQHRQEWLDWLAEHEGDEEYDDD